MSVAAVTRALPPEAGRFRERLRQHLPALRSRYRVRSLGLFGSYVRDEQSPNSDVDVLVEFDEVPSLFEFIRLEDELARVLGRRVDLVMREALKPGIGRVILQEVVPV